MEEWETRLREKIAADPYASRLGIRLVEMGPGHAKFEARPSEGDLNFNGFIHGGFIFTLLDQAFAAASNSHNESAVAVSMSVQYVNAPKPGDLLVGEAREIERSRKLGLYELTVRDGEGRLICRSDARVYRIGKPVV